MATSNKRARELARAKEERRAARAADAAARRRLRQRIVAIVVVAALVLLVGGGFVLSAFIGGDDPQSDASGGTSDAGTGAEDGAGGSQPVASCTAPGEITDTPLTFEAAGDSGLGGAATAQFTFATNCGDIVVAADAAAAPKTVASMAFLAGQGYFDNTLCHRLTTEGIYVLQCGDPTATGGGSPGYTVPDENLPAAGDGNYPKGTVAMANAGPGTAGSQFFIVYDDTTLPGDYTIWGRVTAGLDIVEQVAAAGTTDGGGDGTPAQGVMIGAVEVAPQ